MTDPEGILVIFLDQTGAKSVKAKISPGVTVKKIVPNIITKMQLPTTSPDGTPMSYSLDHKEGGRRLKEDQTLSEAQVKEGDHLIVYPEITAGAALTELYAYIVQGETPNEEGLAMLAFENGQVIPLIAQSREHVSKLDPLLAAFEQATGKTPKLVRFSNREDVTL